MTTRTSMWLLRILVAAVALGVVGWWLRARTRSGTQASAQAGDAAGAARVVPVLVSTAERKDMPVWLEGLGTVAAVQQVTVRPQVDGRLDTVLFTEGQAVKKGQVLAQIDPRPFLVQLHQAEGALARDRALSANGKVNFNRYEELAKEKLIAKQQADDQASVVAQAEGSIGIDLAAVENARLMLDYAQIKSPIDGVVGVRLVDAGNIVHASDPTSAIVVVTELDPVAVFFSLPQDELGRVADALRRGDVTVEAWSRDGLTRLGVGKVAALDNQINQATATLKIKALIPNGERTLWPNQFVKAHLLYDTRRDALVIPLVAVQQGPQGPFVYTVGADQTVAMTPVKVAMTVGELAVIDEEAEPVAPAVTGGSSPRPPAPKKLQAGAQVVSEGQNQLRPGGKVLARPAKGGPPQAPPPAGEGKGRPRAQVTPGEESAR